MAKKKGKKLVAKTSFANWRGNAKNPAKVKKTKYKGTFDKELIKKFGMKKGTEAQLRGKRVTKMGQVRAHLKRYKKITTWTSFKLYGDTRVGGKIFLLRHRENWNIKTIPWHVTDRNGNTCVFAIYTLMKMPPKPAKKTKK